jgi:hypothetical protein
MQKLDKNQSKQKSKFEMDFKLLKTIIKSKKDIEKGNIIAHEEVKVRLVYNKKKSVN